MRLILLLLVSLPASAQIAASLQQWPARYNDQYSGQNRQTDNGRSTNGDTRYTTTLASGAIVGVASDGGGGQQVCTTTGENILAQSISSNFLDETTLNAFYDYSEAGTTGNNPGATGCSSGQGTGSWGDGASWKTGGLFSDHGNLYLSVTREQDSSPFVGQDSSLIMSQNSGSTWCNYTHVVSQACSGNSSTAGETADVPSSGESMWPTLNMESEVWYCVDNSISCPSVDSNSTYAYLFGVTSAEYMQTIMMRVPLTELADLNASEYQYWTGSTWSSSITSATPIITLPTIINQMWYDSTLGYYIALGSMGIAGSGGIYSEITVSYAQHPWGPWTTTQALPTNDQGYSLVVQAQLEDKTVIGGCTVYPLTTSGSYSYSQNSTPLQNNYSTQIASIQFCPVSASVTPRTVQHTAGGIIQNDLYQEFNFAPRADAVVSDSSGQGHNGTSYGGGGTTQQYSGPYSSQGLAGFDQNQNPHDFHVDTGNNYTGTSFTLVIAFNHQGPVVDNETMLWNQTGVGSAGGLCICRDGATVGAWSIHLDKVTSSDVTLTDNAWNELIIVRNGTATSVYDSNSFSGNTATPILTFTTAGDALAGGAIFFGDTGTTSDYFSGSLGYYAFYSRALSTQELIYNQSVILPRLERKGIFLPQPASASLLDGTGAAAAWSLRRVVSGWTGSAVQVERASDSTTENIGFDSSGNFNNATLDSFCSGTTCYVNTWYDQTGNGNNLTCPASSAIIYESGAPVTSGTTGRTSVFGSTNAAYCVTPSNFYYFGIYGSAEMVSSLLSGASSTHGFLQMLAPPGGNCGSAVNPCPLARDSGGESVTMLRTGVTGSTAITYGTASVLAGSMGDFYQYLGVDGSFSEVGTVASPPARLYVNQLMLNLNESYGSEAAFFPYALTAEELSNLRANQKAYYGTP